MLISIDVNGLCAALSLLFTLADTSRVEEERLELKSGKKIIDRIHGVYEDMDTIYQLQEAINTNLVMPQQVDNLRRILLTIVDDVNFIIIKLVECIVRLSDLKNVPVSEQVLTAKKVASIYAPLANRFGIGQLKWKLEDFCFRYLYPEEYKNIAQLLHERRIDRERYIEAFVSYLDQYLQKEGLKTEVYGRPKHIYSIWRKMQKKYLGFNEIFDVHAVRVIVQNLHDCYAALDVVHSNFRHLPNEFDDYVVHPKPNGYQSIHTVVLGPCGKALEIQIRTRQMHEDAERGMAAHWRYKEGSNAISLGYNNYNQSVIWLHKLLLF